MSRRRDPARHRMPELNLTPLIDVVFNLLIFVLVTASFSRPTSLPLDIPRSAFASPSLEAITVTLGTSMSVDGEEVSLLTLEAAARAALSTRGVSSALILADRAVTTGTLVDVQDSLARAGVTSVRLAAEEAR